MIAGWSPVLAGLAALSILLGNFVALAQTNVRRLLAYSAVAHAGYTLLGLVAGGREGFSATLFYTTTYAITLIGAFAVVGFVKRETGGDDFQNFAGLASRAPVVAACMAVFMLSLAGLPPLAGFFGKFYLFSAAFRAQHELFLPTASRRRRGEIDVDEAVATAKLNEARTFDEAAGWLKPKERVALLNDRALIAMLARLPDESAPVVPAKSESIAAQ